MVLKQNCKRDSETGTPDFLNEWELDAVRPVYLLN